MQISEQEQERLDLIFQEAIENMDKLNDFEKGFIESNYDNYLDDKGGKDRQTDFFVTTKMWAIFEQIEKKLDITSA